MDPYTLDLLIRGAGKLIGMGVLLLAMVWLADELGEWAERHARNDDR